MAFTDMNDVEHELGEEKPPNGNGNRNFLIIAGVLGGIMVLALLCIAALALLKFLPGQQSALNANATNEAQATTIVLNASQTASVPTFTATNLPTLVPTNTRVPTNTPVIVLGPTKTPTVDMAVATRNALLTAVAQTSVPTTQPTSQLTSQPTKTALPVTGLADELGTPGLIAAAFVLVVIIFLMRRLRTA
jgi:hypothetical protein